MSLSLFTFVSIAHFLIGFYFVMFGIWNLYHWNRIIAILADKNIPHPYFLLPIGISWQVIAGFMILFGIFAKLAALSLIPYVLVASVIFHPFWAHHGESRWLHFTVFITHCLVVVGALLLLIAPITVYADLLLIN